MTENTNQAPPLNQTSKMITELYFMNDINIIFLIFSSYDYELLSHSNWTHHIYRCPETFVACY